MGAATDLHSYAGYRYRDPDHNPNTHNNTGGDRHTYSYADRDAGRDGYDEINLIAVIRLNCYYLATLLLLGQLLRLKVPGTSLAAMC